MAKTLAFLAWYAQWQRDCEMDPDTARYPENIVPEPMTFREVSDPETR